MQKITYIYFLLLLSCSLYSQKEETGKLEYGVLHSSSIHSNDNFKFKSIGLSVGTGAYFLKQFGKKHVISLDVRLDYAKGNRNNRIVITSASINPIISPSTSTTLISNGVEYQTFSLSLPIKYRYQISEKVPLMLLLGINPYFNLGGKATWYFTQREQDANYLILLESQRTETLEYNFFGYDFLLTGISYKNKKWMFDIYASRGIIDFKKGFSAIRACLKFHQLATNGKFNSALR